MTAEIFSAKMAQLSGSTVTLSSQDNGESGMSAVLSFSAGGYLRADYWRLIESSRQAFSSFDHGQLYGLPEKIDALKDLHAELDGKTITAARFDAETGDLWFEFGPGLKLQVLNMSAYEVWNIEFPDQTGEYSPYAQAFE